MAVAAAVTHSRLQLGLAGAYLGAAGAVALLFVPCVLYRRYKTAHPGGWRQYV